MRHYHYACGDDALIRVTAHRQPSAKHPKGYWVVRDRRGDEWVMPSFPEITWATLKKFEYLGSVETEVSRSDSAK